MTKRMAKKRRPAGKPVTGAEDAAARESGQELPVSEETGEDAVVAAEPSEDSAEALPSADAGQSFEAEGEGAPARLSWEEILSDPEYRRSYDEAVQGIVKARLRRRGQAEARLERLEPVLRALEEAYGLTEESDVGALSALLRESAGLRRPSGEEIEAHLEALAAEAEALRESVPDFDLLRELEDPDFLRLTAPHSGVRLADAYYARHRAEREREMARQSLEAVSRSVRSLGMRPGELRETGSGARFALDPRQMSRGEREALKKRIYEAKAQGRRITVGE